jgi:hypothetical protein
VGGLKFSSSFMSTGRISTLMNSSESMNCAAARVAFLSPSRSSASSRSRMPPDPSFVASNAACSRSCSAVSRVSSTRSASSDEPASWALRASAADDAATAASRSDRAESTTAAWASAAARACT